ncbi:MAG: hypothetical protein P0116_14415 [Candidatus Nitrosocosmicus sp.]|nr:hypothetical protein [Candidatus Nitrosocosmicus sp.]
MAIKKQDIPLYFGIYDLDLPHVGTHGSENQSDFLDKSFYSIINWEYKFGNIDMNGISHKNYTIFGVSSASWAPLKYPKTIQIHLLIVGKYTLGFLAPK